MQFLRRRLSSLTAVWLTVQIATFAAPAVAIEAGPSIANDEQCTCPGEMPGAQCPMHKSGHSQKPAGPSDCAMRSAFDFSAAALFAFASSGFVPAATIEAHVPAVSQPVVLETPSFASRAHSPEYPPPRV